MYFKRSLQVILLAAFLSTGPSFAVENAVDETAVVDVQQDAQSAPEAQGTTSNVPAPVVATTPPQADLGTAIVKLMEGVQNKNWLLVSCAVLMVLIWVWDIVIMPRLISGEKHPKWRAASPWISIGIASVAQFASAVIAGNTWVDALNTAAMMGFTTSGMWSAGGKKALGVVEQKLKPSAKK